VSNHKIAVEGQTAQKMRGDRDRLKQVLTNLITNAIKYSPRAGRVIVSLTKRTNAVEVRVKDFGIGIPAEQQKKIFDRFFQVERPLGQIYPGLGLGLYITKEIIERHQGEIWLESKPGEGTTFTVRLPFVATGGTVERKK
jgi:signal transduction histidine kinase